MSTALVNTRVIVGDGSELEGASVVIEMGRIVAVSRDGRFRADCTLDLEGRTIMPGMIDVHTHMVGGSRMGSNDAAIALGLTDPVIKAVFDSVENGRTTLRAGITTVRETGGRDFIDTFMKRAQAAGQIEAPRMLVSGPGLFMTGGHGSWNAPTSPPADGVDEIVRRVRELVGKNVDVLKIFSTEGPESRIDWLAPATVDDWLAPHYTRQELEAAITEAHRLGRTVAAEGKGPNAIKNFVEAGGDTVEHGWYLTEESCALMINHGVHLVPTLGCIMDVIHKGPALGVFEALTPWGEAEIPDRFRMAIELGVKIAMGSDAGGLVCRPNGVQADELSYYVLCGMSPMQAIGSATLEAARALRLENEVGTIEQGKAADIVILDGDPLGDIGLAVSGVVGVIQAGNVVRDDLGLLDEMRRDDGTPLPRPLPAVDLSRLVAIQTVHASSPAGS